jgi:hypothetical protein
MNRVLHVMRLRRPLISQYDHIQPTRCNHKVYLLDSALEVVIEWEELEVEADANLQLSKAADRSRRCLFQGRALARTTAD